MRQEFLSRIGRCCAYAIHLHLNIKETDELTLRFVEPIVDWSIEPQFKTGCIESMGLSVNRVRCTIEHNGGVINFDTNLPEFKDWTITDVVLFDKHDGSIAPKSIDFYFEDKSVEVY